MACGSQRASLFFSLAHRGASFGKMKTLRDHYAARIEQGDISSDPAQEAVLPELERIRTELGQPVRTGWFAKAPKPVKGLYIWGGVGRGKSMLMDMLFDAVDVPKQRSHFHGFMQWVHAEMAKARARGVNDAIVPVAKLLTERVRFLAFDEMQITDITDAMIVGRLFERLFDAGVTVVTTSNRVPDDLYKDGLNRALFEPFIALIKDRLVVWELASPTDHRQGRLAGSTTYFTPLGAKAREGMNEFWEGMVCGEVSSLMLRVKGRDFVIPAFSNGVARASFFELCAQPVGAADYLALSKAVRVLFIDEIPQLSRSNFNEARRFVTLIDALYEARVQVIASAAAAPELLYVEGSGTFEFERTASRLREMQSDDWRRDRKPD